MRRTERLFKIIQILRRSRRPVKGQEIADELETSLRTVYRDMAELIAQHTPIRGEAGTGYVIDSDYDMPPLMLTHDELEAAVLGAAWVAERGDPALSRGARDLIAKLTEAVPDHLRPVLLDDSLRPFSLRSREIDRLDVSGLRSAIRDRRKVRIAYSDGEEKATERTVWPFLIGYMEHVRLLCAWCEMRQAFRHFRTDRILSMEVLDEPYPERRAHLKQKWKAEMEKQRREKSSDA